MGALVQAELDGHVALLRLNRPERHNSLVPELLESLLAGIGQVRAGGARVCILEAAGRSFSTGGDVGAFLAHTHDLAAYADHLVGLLNEAILGLVDLPMPLVAAVDGPVTGGSLGLVLAADIVLVGDAASFTPWYGTVGFSPDGGWTAMLPEVAGRARVAEVLCTDRRVTATEAVAWGIAARQVPSADLASEARDVAARITELEPGSIRSARRLLWDDRTALAARLDAERRAFVTQVVSDGARAGMCRFVTGRSAAAATMPDG